jgi:hypothetical protein
MKGAGNYTVTYFSSHVAGNLEATKTATFTLVPMPTAVTLVAVKGSFLRNGVNNTNQALIRDSAYELLSRR